MRILRLALLLVASVGLTACGGGGPNAGTCSGSTEVCTGVSPGPSPTPTPPQAVPTGVYAGTTSDGRAVTAIVQADSEIWALFGAAGERSGVWHGTGSFSGGSFTSSDLRELTAASAVVRSGSASGTYSSGVRLSATVNTGAITTFVTTYDPASIFPLSTTDAAGNYAGTAASPGRSDAATFSVGSNGVVNGTFGSSCQFTGTLLPQASLAVYDLTLSFAGLSCPIGLASSSASGIAYLEGTRLHAAVLTAARSNGLVLSGART